VKQEIIQKKKEQLVLESIHNNFVDGKMFKGTSPPHEQAFA